MNISQHEKPNKSSFDQTVPPNNDRNHIPDPHEMDLVHAP